MTSEELSGLINR